jgi:heat shock 70kDa protein 1/6/8
MPTVSSKFQHRTVLQAAKPPSVRFQKYTPPAVSDYTLGITNSVGRLSGAEIDQMIKDAEQFKQADKDFSARHEAKSDLEAYIHQVEGTITSPEIGMKLKRGAKAQVEAELARALEKLEIEDSTADELKKAQLGIKRALQKATAGIR